MNSDPYSAWVARVEAVEGADAALTQFLTGIDVHIPLTMEGVRLTQKGVADGSRAMAGGKLIIDFIS